MPDGAPSRAKEGALPPPDQDTKYSYLWNCRGRWQLRCHLSRLHHVRAPLHSCRPESGSGGDPLGSHMLNCNAFCVFCPKAAYANAQVSWTRQRALCLPPTTTVQGRRSRRSYHGAWAVSAAGVSAGPALPLTLPRCAGHITSFFARVLNVLCYKVQAKHQETLGMSFQNVF